MDNIHAIDKFVAEATNYRLVEVEYFGKKTYVPQFIVEVQWTCNRDHMVGKWIQAIKTKEPSSYLIRFYCQLDETNKMLLSQWVVEKGSHRFIS